ncbi:hypothetical protein QBC34DRAFT_198103 [Podospora aff. communis PSN243]|uniref:Exonuclease domain-containing protein n=1 Tax=Podospora aff. communis PSN243 TaxID=3040156 RepID=A0AAV9G604_9PEZI|nr:hypothetical protein QBC34DRAFT_198103 [Podospora aff. communis PSN243]
MVTVYNSWIRDTQCEAGRLSAVDVLTGETLVDAIVEPAHPVVNWRGKITGLSKETLQRAKDEGTHLRGWRGARWALWKHINADTILVGHALEYDMQILRMWHHNVIDTSILTKTAMAPDLARRWSLQKLSLSFLKEMIQDGSHCSTEDAQAAAAIVKIIVSNPGLLELWAKDADRLARWGRASEARLRTRMQEALAAASCEVDGSGGGVQPEVFKLPPETASALESA